MRLIHRDEHGKLSLTKNLSGHLPPYAILSHTWGRDQDEITFEDMQNGAWKDKAGRAKLSFCETQARKDGLNHFWIDTCCICKSDPAELQEAITSMFRWYAESAKCYVFFSDVSSHKRSYAQEDTPQVPEFREARWFTRGWTLQELLAPNRVEFYSREGDFIGDRISLEQKIHEITCISKGALRGLPLSDFSVDERMRWASNRETTKEEDQAYCLTGIFGICMLPNYGEGPYAFERLKREIADAVRSEVDKIAPPWRSSRPCETDAKSKADHRMEFLRSLSFDQMESRQSTIKDPDVSTCKWFLSHPAYLEWVKAHALQENRGFLWLIGKPGVGKSTLMKYALAHAEQSKPKDEIIISFFFNARGDQLERSTAGMYRALLCQLFAKATHLVEVLDDFEIQPWTVAILCKIFLAAAAKLGKRPLRCFIDALDECPEQQIQDMVVFLEELGANAMQSNARLYVCFASRHYPMIDIRYGQRLVLEEQQGHSEDVSGYVRNHLRAGYGKTAEDVKDKIQEKANGVFLWVVLVVRILNDEFRRGSIFRVKTRLRELPPQLGDLFRDILFRDNVNKKDLLLALQWILFAVRPLRSEEFYFAMVAGLDPDPSTISQWDPEATTLDDMARFVLSSSKGLAELTKSTTPTVQFIHESVRDYLIKDNGLIQLWPEIGANLKSLSHDELKRCCNNYLQADLSSYNLKDPALPDYSLRNAVNALFPFLEYATRFIWRHAEEGKSNTNPQSDFLESFNLETWRSISNVLQESSRGLYTRNTSLLYILAEHGCPELINSLRDSTPTISDQRGRYGHAVFAALANGHRDAVRALLLRDQSRPSSDSDNPNLKHGRRLTSFNAVDKSQRTALHWAAEFGWLDVVRLLIDVGAKVNAIDNTWATALHVASGSGCKEVVQLLVSNGADTAVVNYKGHTALHIACREGFEETVRVLIAGSTNINQTDKEGDTALTSAIARHQKKIVQLLIDNGADLDATPQHNITPLHMAFHQAGSMELVQLLVDNGANLDADHQGETVLLMAVAEDWKEGVQMLIDKGANIEVTDKSGWTALHWATYRRLKEMVQLLIDKGANIEAVNASGETALHLAVKKGWAEGARLLIDIHAKMEASTKSGETPLHLAIKEGLEELIRLLVTRGANMEAIDRELGGTALHMSCRFGQIEVVRLLIDSGANIEAPNHNRWTALFWASCHGETEVVRLLIDKGANIQATDKGGHTPLYWASQNGAKDIVQLLVERGCKH